MKILAIRGRNLASLEGDFVIDFTQEPLASAGIFAISGPTGAGKSTLLDAMCLALFSKTPRTEQAKENNVRLKDVNEEVLPQSDPRFLLRRGTSSGYAEVDFLALNGHRYRSRWSVSRAYDKENGRLQAARTTLYDLDTEREEQGNRTDIQSRIIELIGLTFDQFTRSVLLAQNDFSTFLKAEQGDKASLLEKLTGTEQYSNISRLIYAKNVAAKDAFDKLNAQVQGIELLSEDEVKDLRDRIAGLEKDETRLEKLKAERQTLRESLKTISAQTVVKEKQEVENERLLKKAQESLSFSQKEYEKEEKTLADMDKEAKILRADLLQARKLDVQLESSQKITGESEMQMSSLLGRKQKTEKKLRDIEKQQQKAQDEYDRLVAWQLRYQSRAEIANQLSVLLLHLDACSSIRLSIEKVKKNRQDIERNQQKLKELLLKEQNRFKGFSSDLGKLEKEKGAIEQALKQTTPEVLEQLIENERTKRERLLLEQAQFVTTGDIKGLRDKLIEGNPCPVCGSLVHPYASHEVHDRLLVLASRISEATVCLNRLLERKKEYESFRKRLADLQRDELDLHKSISETENTQVDLKNQLQSLSVQIEREDANQKEQVTQLEQSMASATELFGNKTWQVNWEQDPEKFRCQLEDFANQWQKNSERLQELEKEKSAYQAQKVSYIDFLPSIQAQYDQAKMLYDKNNAELIRLRSSRMLLFDGNSADEVEASFHKKKDAIKSHLKELQDSVTRYMGELEQYKGMSGQIKKDLAEMKAHWEESQRALDDWTLSYEKTAGGESLEDMLSKVASQKTESVFRLRTHEENLRKAESFKQELEEKRLISESWAKLNDLAGSADGAKFRRIAQGYTLDVLLTYANVQLRQLSRRYRLERVPDTLALEVIDQDMCDEVRTVHSLSGGESFLVSLALALGLSSFSSNRMKVESLFIDEGFGSLDAETLRVAMDALENLRTQGRKIGVISHVQEMTERIPAQIRVSRLGNGRSFIKVV